MSKKTWKRGPRPLPIYGNLPANKRPKQTTLLEVWLKANGISHDAFARLVGCNERMVDYWCEGRCVPSLIYAFMIERATKGEVPAPVWLGTEIGKMQWRRIEDRINAQKKTG
jgi:DNA-binding transcriptional regulator YdaS (Cro superfamily)